MDPNETGWIMNLIATRRSCQQWAQVMIARANLNKTMDHPWLADEMRALADTLNQAAESIVVSSSTLESVDSIGRFRDWICSESHAPIDLTMVHQDVGDLAKAWIERLLTEIADLRREAKP